MRVCRQCQRLATIADPREAFVAVPVFIAHVAIAQIGDAGAAELAQTRKRCGVGAGAEQQIEAVAAAFQRSTVVRAAEEHHRAQFRQPVVADDAGMMASATRYQPAHAVADERSEEHTSELQSLMRISYAVFCLK